MRTPSSDRRARSWRPVASRCRSAKSFGRRRRDENSGWKELAGWFEDGRLSAGLSSPCSFCCNIVTGAIASSSKIVVVEIVAGVPEQFFQHAEGILQKFADM